MNTSVEKNRNPVPLYETAGAKRIAMRIDINQKRISIGDKYKIFMDQKETYSASSELFKLLSVIDNHRSKRHQGNGLSVNIGNIGGEVKPFDPYRQPRSL